MLHNIRYFGSIAIIYTLTVGTIGAMLSSSLLFGQHTDTTKELNANVQTAPAPTKKIIAGKPIRIVIADRAIDLPIDEGGYDPATKSWKLSEAHADYAITTALANNHTGTTFIYGHGTDAVFGRLGSNQPPAGTIAQLYTSSGRVFTYKLQTITNLKPTDTAILNGMAGGSPGLIVQTCTGVFSEWRTMFKFTFERVEWDPSL